MLPLHYQFLSQSNNCQYITNIGQVAISHLLLLLHRAGSGTEAGDGEPFPTDDGAVRHSNVLPRSKLSKRCTTSPPPPFNLALPLNTLLSLILRTLSLTHLSQSHRSSFAFVCVLVRHGCCWGGGIYDVEGWSVSRLSWEREGLVSSELTRPWTMSSSPFSLPIHSRLINGWVF